MLDIVIHLCDYVCFSICLIRSSFSYAFLLDYRIYLMSIQCRMELCIVDSGTRNYILGELNFFRTLKKREGNIMIIIV
jgi:hypothetical protein